MPNSTSEHMHITVVRHARLFTFPAKLCYGPEITVPCCLDCFVWFNVPPYRAPCFKFNIEVIPTLTETSVKAFNTGMCGLMKSHEHRVVSASSLEEMGVI